MKALMIAASVLAAVSIFAADFKPDQLIAHWRIEDKSVKRTCDVTFDRDGTFSGTGAQDGKVAWTYSGKWSLRGKNLEYEYTSSSLAAMPKGWKDHDEIVELTADYVIFKAVGTDGRERKYLRVK
jgi:hypothetical protein